MSEDFNDFFSNIGPNLADNKILAQQSTECQFKDYIKYANAEFTTFKPVTIKQIFSSLSYSFVRMTF